MAIMAVTDMVTEAKKRIRTDRKIVLPIVLPVLFLFAGCQTAGVDMTPELASQIASDASGLEENEITDLTCTEEGGGYTVAIAGEKGTYTIGISANGKVTSYQFEKPEEENPEEEPENEEPKSENEEPESETSKPEEQSSEKEGDSSKEESDSDQKDNSEEDGLSLPEGSYSKEELIKAVADHIKNKEVRQEDYTLTMRDDDMVEVDVQGEDGRHYTVTISPMTRQIVYTRYTY